jgi:hypothetical protein
MSCRGSIKVSAIAVLYSSDQIDLKPARQASGVVAENGEDSLYDRLPVASFNLRDRHVGDASVMSGNKAIEFLY